MRKARPTTAISTAISVIKLMVELQLAQKSLCSPGLVLLVANSLNTLISRAGLAQSVERLSYYIL